MNWFLPLVLVGLSLGLVLLSVATWSLRDFSRSALEEACRTAGYTERFGIILKQYHPVRMSLEHLLYLGAAVLGGLWILWYLPNDPTVRYQITAWPWWFYAGWLLLPWLLVGLPWSLSRLMGEVLLSRTWPLWTFLAFLGAPYGRFARRWDLLSHRLSNVPIPETQEAETIADEIRSVTEEGHREGVLEAEARTMIHRVIDFYDVDVADIMTPRTEMVCLPSTASLQDARQLLLEEGHSRVPVIGRTPDEVHGILYARDLLRYLDGSLGMALSLAEVAREPYYVPKTMGIDSLLKSLKKERVQMAIVLDEYGGVAGLVTMEDILEELVGEIVDEFDSASDSEEFHVIDPQTTDIYAKAHIDDVNERLGLQIPNDDEIDTIGGFVFSLFGRIPVTGEQTHWNNLEFTVLEAHKRRIARLRLKVLPPQAAEAE